MDIAKGRKGASKQALSLQLTSYKAFGEERLFTSSFHLFNPLQLQLHSFAHHKTYQRIFSTLLPFFNQETSPTHKMLAYNVIVLGLAAVASAQTFSGFSDSGIVCQGGNTATKAEVDSAIVGPKGTITQAKASDLGYGRCQNLNVPMYSQPVGDKFIINYAFDKASNTYNFCSASISGNFYGKQCQPI
ncbi:hypothetical protein MCOR16_000527 [Pyricularia oryzae]|nr:hypothetical protein MCOR16_000527 [Pyricularia oryzae]